MPAALSCLVTRGGILAKGAGDSLACFDRAGAYNGSTEAINGRVEHLLDTALGFRKTNHVAGSLLGSGGFSPKLNRDPGEPH